MFAFDFITADTHFNHNKIISLGERPFANTDEMDEVFIKILKKLV